MSSIVLADRYEILLESPLQEFNTSTAKAYDVRDLSQPDAKLYALKTSVFPSPRLSVIEPLFNLFQSSPNMKMLKIVYAANTAWETGDLERSIALIYKKPSGPQLMRSLYETIQPWTEEQVTRNFIAPMNELLQHLFQNNISHHAIRPTNIYYEDNETKESIIVGECLSEPPGYGQDSAFEPLSRALADPISRGESTDSTDLYALGVTISFLLNGGSPISLADERTLTISRIETGSFNTFLPRKNISPGMTDLLKGLLADSDDARWTLKELNTWLTNGKVLQVPVILQKRASRPIFFNGKDDIYTPNLLAYEMRRNPLAALDLISKTDIAMWLKNGLNDNARVHQLQELNAILAKGASPSEKLIGILQILDKGSPLFWQGKSFTIAGFGAGLAESIICNDPIENYVKLISSSIFSYYLNDNKTIGSINDENSIARKIQTVRNAMEYRGMGGGIENCLYSLCQDLPCLSPILKSYNALRIPDILFGLNLIGMSIQEKPEEIIDRHIAAFISVREQNVPQRYFHDMETTNNYKKNLAVIKLLAELQRRYKVPKLSGLANWIIQVSIPLLNQYKNVHLRQMVQKRLEALAEEGNLKYIVKLLDNRKALEADQIGLKNAQAEAISIDKKVKSILSSLSSPAHYSESIGQNNAMIISAVLSLGFILFYIVLKVLI